MSAVRTERLTRLKSDPRFDVIVVGGGVNGIGVYRELSLQGLRVLLVDRNDFASGCSAAPSRMIHGGLRYLENGEFGLVRESLAERDALLRMAPHMVRPLPTMIPITRLASGTMNSAARFLGRSGRPAPRGALPIKLGLMLYDWISRRHRALPRHEVHGSGETQRRWPALTPEVRYSAVYHDAWISHPERLCIEMIRDIEEAAPASIALNYAEITASETGFTLTCRRGGDPVEVSASAIVNATGAWLDSTARALGGTAAEEMVSGTKGSHLILHNPRLAESLNGHMVYFENSDGRVCIVFPYLGEVLAGATDIRVKNASRVRCEDAEADYIIASLRHIFPDVPVGRDDILLSFSGVRPLPASDHEFTGRISRGHSVVRLDGKIPQFCMIGGKWTTFRAFGEQTATEVLRELGRKRVRGTSDIPIGGGRAFPPDAAELETSLRKVFGLTAARAAHLAGHYGTLAAEIARVCSDDPEDRQLGESTLYRSAEIRWLILNEHVETLADIVLRRTSLAITGEISMSVVDALAAVLGDTLKLTPAKITEQKGALLKELGAYYGVAPEVLRQRNKERSMECA